MSKRKDVNTPIGSPNPGVGAKIVEKAFPRGQKTTGTKVLSTSNTRNADKSKGVEIKAGNRGHA